MIGDHIRALVNGGWRHAIDCGDGTVLHLTSDPAATPMVSVRRSYRPEFVAGATQVEVVVHRERVFPVRQVVSRAYSRAKDPSLAGTFTSSAAFASWCKAGHSDERSENVSRPIPALVEVAGPATVPAPRPTPKPAVKPAAPKPAAKAKPAAKTKAPKTAKKAPAKKVPARKAAPKTAKRPAPKKAARPTAKTRVKAKTSAKKPPARAARRPAPKAPAKARGRTAARRKGAKGRGARR